MVSNTLRLVADVVLEGDGPDRRRQLWLRILGDDLRGYLVVGDIDPAGSLELDDFWFPSLELALAAAERAGVPRAAWEIDASSPVTITARVRRGNLAR
jgi:hypothetical protein